MPTHPPSQAAIASRSRTAYARAARIALTLALVWLGSPGVALATTYYVSSAGDDGRAGTSEATAWRTLDRVAMAAPSLRPGDSVLFRRGDRFTGAVIVSQSGAAGMPITYGAYGSGPRPILSALSALSGWSTVRPGIHEATVPGRPASVHLAVQAGALLPLGRFPRADAASSGYLSVDSASGATSITDAALAGAPDFTGGELVLRLRPWVLTPIPITGTSGTTLSFAPYPDASRYALAAGQGFFVQNHPSALAADGDWAYDATRGVLVVRNASGPPAVSVPTVEDLVSVTSRSHVVLASLALEGANDDAIFLDRTDQVTIQDCEIRLAGRHAIYAIESTNVSVSGSTITDSIDVGIEVHQPRGDGVTITDNTIERTGTIAGMGSGRDVSYRAVSVRVRSDATIARNVIRDTGFVGIAFFGNGIHIENNVIEHFCYVKDDGGAIYTWNGGTPVMPWTDRHVVGNVISRSDGAPDGKATAMGDVEGIYLDNNSMDVEVAGNTVYDVLGSGLYGNSIQDVVATRNTFYDVGHAIGLTRYVDDGSDSNGGQDLARVTISDNVLFPRTPEQLLYQYTDRGLDFPMASTLEARLRAIGTIDRNILSPMSSLPVGVSYRRTRTMPWVYPWPWPFEEWRRASGADAASTFVDVPAGIEVARRLTDTLATNGTFDADVAGTSLFSPDGASMRWDGSGALTGAGSLAVSTATPTTRAFESMYGNIGPVTAGRTYLVRFRLRGPSDGVVRTSLRDRPGATLSSEVVAQGYGTSASQHEVLLTATASAAIGCWQIALKSSSATSYLDDVEVYEVDGRIVPPEERVRFEVNPTGTPLDVILDGIYRDARGAEHVGLLRLAPFSSAVLVREGDLPPELDAGLPELPDAYVPPGVDAGPLPDARIAWTPDAAGAAEDGGAVGDAGTAQDAGSIRAPDAGPGTLAGTCSCRAGADGRAPGLPWPGLVWLALARRRARRPRRGA